MMPWETLDRQTVWLAGHCDVGLHGECLPLLGTESECGCPCHMPPRSGRILVGHAPLSQDALPREHS